VAPTIAISQTHENSRNSSRDKRSSELVASMVVTILNRLLHLVGTAAERLMAWGVGPMFVQGC
jgi:hypothetical protein